MEVLNDLLGYKNLKIYQNKEMFSFSLDSVLLTGFVEIKKNVNNILDIGTGNAPIPLILSTKTKAKITAVEIQKDVYKLACKSVKYNELENQIKVINDDICNLYKKMDNEIFDIITCNPPFFKMTEKVKLSDSSYKQIARHELFLDIEKIAVISKKLLKNNGSLYLVHRPERLSEIIKVLNENTLEVKKLKFVYPKQNSMANMVLIEAIKMGKSGIKIDYPIISHNNDGTYTDDVLKYFS